MGANVLVTGGTGLVGYGLVRSLLNQGFHPILLVRKTSNVDKFISLGSRITCMVTDFSEREALRKTASTLKERQLHIEATVYALGVTEAPTTEDYNFANAEQLRYFLQAFEQEGVSLGKFVLIGSLSIHGSRGRDAGVLLSETPIAPLSDYARSKWLAEQVLDECYPNAVVVRPAAVFGEYDRQMVIVHRMVKKGCYVYFGTNKNTVGVVHSEDLADHIVACISTQPWKPKERIISATHNLTVRDYLSAIAKAYGQKRRIEITVPLWFLYVAARCNEWMYQCFRRRKTPVFNRQKVAELVVENWTCDTRPFYETFPERDASIDSFKTRIQQTADWYLKNAWIK